MNCTGNNYNSYKMAYLHLIGHRFNGAIFRSYWVRTAISPRDIRKFWTVILRKFRSAISFRQRNIAYISVQFQQLFSYMPRHFCLPFIKRWKLITLIVYFTIFDAAKRWSSKQLGALVFGAKITPSCLNNVTCDVSCKETKKDFTSILLNGVPIWNHTLHSSNVKRNAIQKWLFFIGSTWKCAWFLQQGEHSR